MSPFEFIFSFFGLLLGLSLVQVLGGLARIAEAKFEPGATLRVGWLTPLLGIFVMLDLLSFWLSAWDLREIFDVRWATLMFGLWFAGTYYLAAHLSMPREPERYDDLDAHFWRVRRWVLGILFLTSALQAAYYAVLPAYQALFTNPATLTWIVSYFVLIGAAMTVRRRGVAAVILAAMILRYLVTSFLWG